MSPMGHFLFGMLCGTAIACLVVMFRRRWGAMAPPFVLACGFWAELPHLLGLGDTTHWAANVFFGYPWLHPSLSGSVVAEFAVFLVIANVLVAGYAAFLTWYFWTVDTVRWEQGGWEGKSRSGKSRSGTRHSSTRRSRNHRRKE